MIKSITIFDFDKTLVFTPEPEEGKIIFKNKTGLDWPYGGWWSKKESLNLDIFDMPLNHYTYLEYLKSISKEGNYTVLATGRIEKLRKEVKNVLISKNLVFDEVHLNKLSDILTFKKNLFEKLINKFNPDEIIIYDDRKPHIEDFKIWSKSQLCDVYIIDVTESNKNPFIIKNK